MLGSSANRVPKMVDKVPSGIVEKKTNAVECANQSFDVAILDVRFLYVLVTMAAAG